jgi:HSP20 family protein
MSGTQIDVKKTPPAPRQAADPFSLLRSEMDRLFDRFGAGFGLAPFGRLFDMPALRAESRFQFSTPAVDVTEDDKAYHIAAELPGMAEKDVEVKLTDELLTLKGEKREEREEKDKNYHLTERAYGSFERSFRLPSGVDRDKIAAEFKNGVLTITLPKTPEAQKQEKKIPIGTGG